jgi:ribosomal protein RSM22 (predicted rRNA methylase)
MEPFNRATVQRHSPLLDKVVQRLVARDYALPIRRLSGAVQELSHLFTRERRSLPSDYLDDAGFAAAYLSYFLPVNAAKVQALLDELPMDVDLAEKTDGELSVLDLGSGPGTAGLAVLDWMVQKAGKDINLRVVSVDRSQTAIKDSMRLWEGYCREAGIGEARLKACVGDLEKTKRGQVWNTLREASPYDLIIIANCLNELFGDAADAALRRTELVGRLVPLLQPHGSIMIIEPALRRVSRELHEVRDRLLQSKLCTVYSPCLHGQTCPALVHPDDWCHEERPWVPSAAIQAIDREVGFIKDALKFSYLLLRKDGRTIVERQPNVYRVVSELREFKGEKRAWLCNELGRSEVGRLDRLASAQNAAVDHWHRGAIVQIEKIVRKERDGKVSTVGRIERDTAVQIVRST